MAVRNNFAAGEVLLAADLNDTFAAKLNIAGGKILQIVRATDSTNRSTTSTTFTDVTGMSVTITPQKSDSAVLIIAATRARTEGVTGAGDQRGLLSITDNSNNAISGGQEAATGVNQTAGLTHNEQILIVAYATPATTSSVTYKLRFRSVLATAAITLDHNLSTGQMFAIEVSA